LTKTQAELQGIAKAAAVLQQEKDLLLMRKHTAEQLRDPAKRQKFFDAEIKACQTQQAHQQKESTDAGKQIA
jgi:hypothetical protein